MDPIANRIVDVLYTVVVTTCVFMLGVAVGWLERECPVPRPSNVTFYRQGLEVYSTEELQRIINARRRMERVKEKEK